MSSGSWSISLRNLAAYAKSANGSDEANRGDYSGRGDWSETVPI